MMAEARPNLVRDRINNFNKSQESDSAPPTTRDETAATPPRRKPPPPPRPVKPRPSVGPPPLPAAKPRKPPPVAVKGSIDDATCNTADWEEPEPETDEDYVHMRAPGVLGHDDACIVTVTGFQESVTEEVLRDHFQDVQRSGGGPVDLVSILSGTAAICFNNKQDAERVLETRQELDDKALRLCPYSESVIEHGFVISGKSPDTSAELVADFLESKTEHLIECTSSMPDDCVMVLFMKQNCPDLAQLQTILRSCPLEGKTLTVSQYFMMTNDYDEPVQEHSIYTTEEKIRFFKNYKMKDLQKMMKKKGIDLTVDSENFRIKLSRKSGDFQEDGPCIEGVMEELNVNQYNIILPGVYTFLRSEQGQITVSDLEKEETCTVFVEEDIYEDVQCQEDTSAGSLGDDSNPSSGSCKSDEVPETKGKSKTREVDIKPTCEYGLIQKSNTMGRFQVGKCQFLVKEGHVENEEVECAVNISRSDIDQIGDWKKKRGTAKATLSKTLASKGVDWSKKGIMASEVPGLPCKYSILVSLKHSGGNVAKAIKRCIKIADVLKVNSMAFFYKGIDDTREEVLQPFLQDYVESVYKYQRTESPTVTDIRLVVDRMAEEYIPGVQHGIESLLDVKRKSGILHHFMRKVRLKSSSSPSSPGTGFQTYVPIDLVEETDQEPEQEDATAKDDVVFAKDDEVNAKDDDVDVLDKNGQLEYLYSSEAVVSVCSSSETTNNRVHQKLVAICQQHIPLKEIRDARIQKLTQKQMKALRRRAGRKVELLVNREDGLIEMRGYSLEVQHVYDNCKKTVDSLPVDTEPTPNIIKIVSTSLKAEAPDTTDSTGPNEATGSGTVLNPERNVTPKNTDTNVPTKQSYLNEAPTTPSSIASSATPSTPSTTLAASTATPEVSTSSSAMTTASPISNTTEPHAGNKQEDEFDIFGKHIAYELRGITDVEKRTKLKRDIQKLIFMAQD